MKKITVLFMVLIGILAIGIVRIQAQIPTPIDWDKNALPPQILQWYDLDVIEGKRPSVLILENKDTWNLSEEPAIDWVILDNIDTTLLTGFQMYKLQNWVYSGINVCIISPERLPSILPTVFGIRVEELSTKDYNFYLNKNHVVNADITSEKLHLSYKYIVFDPSNKRSIIVSRDKMVKEALAGILYYGKGRIYFNTLSSTGNPDYIQSRFQLNLQQWLASKEVPKLTLNDIVDGVVPVLLKQKDRKVLFGRVLEPTETHFIFKHEKISIIMPWRNTEWIEIEDESFINRVPDEFRYIIKRKLKKV